MNDLHLGHHILATIAVKGLLLGWDSESHKPIWRDDAPEQLRDAVLDFVMESTNARKKPKK